MVQKALDCFFQYPQSLIEVGAGDAGMQAGCTEAMIVLGQE